MKHFLRLKFKENPQRLVNLWSRVAIVVDSELPDMKFILEITETGFEWYEFLSRMLTYKREQDKVIAYMRGARDIGDHAKNELIRCGKWLQGKNWKQIFSSEDQEHKWIIETV